MQEKEYSAKQKEMFAALEKLNCLAEENGYEKKIQEWMKFLRKSQG